MHLFGQLKRIAREWLDGGYLRCTGGTYPAQLIYQEIADMAAERIKAAITRGAGRRASGQGDPRPLQPDRLDPLRQFHHIEGDAAGRPITRRVPRQLGRLRQRLGGGVLPRRRGAPARARLRQEPGPRLRGAVSATARTPQKYLPDFIVRVDDGRADDPLESRSSRSRAIAARTPRRRPTRCDAYWVPGVNNLGTFGRWAFAEFKESVYAIAANFDALIERAVAGSGGMSAWLYILRCADGSYYVGTTRSGSGNAYRRTPGRRFRWLYRPPQACNPRLPSVFRAASKMPWPPSGRSKAGDEKRKRR